MNVKYIDINCDVGEGIGNDEIILPMISSCNIATGGHAGTAESMRKVIQLAKANTVKIGAHPSYPDKENFGRKSIALSAQELIETVKSQLIEFENILDQENAVLHHIKPHGALYNDIAKNKDLAKIFLKAIETYKEQLFLYVPFNSEIEQLAQQEGYNIKHEAFGDRNYNADGSLVSRKLEDAVISEPENVLKHIVSMANHEKIVLTNGQTLAVKADTFCIHGDTPSAYEILRYLAAQLPEFNIMIET